MVMITDDNYAICKFPLEAFADDHDFRDHIDGDPALPEKKAMAVQTRKKAQGGRLIMSTISSQTLLALGENIVSGTPHEMMRKIADIMAKNTSG